MLSNPQVSSFMLRCVKIVGALKNNLMTNHHNPTKHCIYNI